MHCSSCHKDWSSFANWWNHRCTGCSDSTTSEARIAALTDALRDAQRELHYALGLDGNCDCGPKFTCANCKSLRETIERIDAVLEQSGRQEGI